MELVSEIFSGFGSLLRPLIVRETLNKTGNSDLALNLNDWKKYFSVDPSRDYIYDELGDLLRVIYPDQFPHVDAIVDGTDDSHSNDRHLLYNQFTSKP